METTRRARGTAALAGVLAVGAVVLQRPLLLAGAAGVGGWLLARQARFAREAAALAADLAVEVSPTRESVLADDPLTVTAEVRLPRDAPAPVKVAVTPPVGATGADEDDLTMTVPRGERTARTSFQLSFPVAGDHRFGRPAVTVADPGGLFHSHPVVGEGPSIAVEPRAPRNVHVGEGGEQVAGAFGEHATGEHGPGLVPSELREYAPGDPADSIDWKATARLGEAHVRQYEVEVDLETAILLDHRATMAAGPAGRRKVDFARAVALSYLASVAADGGAVGLYAVGDDGLTAVESPDTGEGHYAGLRARLREVEPTPGPGGRQDATRPPGEQRRRAQRLAGEDTPFAAAVRPFLADAERYVRRIDADPLYRAVRSHVRPAGSAAVTVLVTDDSHPAELRETVELATRGDDRVVAFLLPTVLFEPGGLADLEDAYGRYVEFEEFRRDLASLPRVSAFEVAPGDRIEALLASRERRREA